jgi:hypothetical protein
MTNQTLISFLTIKEQISALEKQLKPLKEEIEANGSMENDQFSVIIQEIEQNRVVGADELLLKVGIVKVTELELIKTSTYNKLIVKVKAAAVKAA